MPDALIVETLEDHNSNVALCFGQVPVIEEAIHHLGHLTTCDHQPRIHVTHTRQQSTQLHHQEHDAPNEHDSRQGFKSKMQVVKVTTLAEICNDVANEE